METSSVIQHDVFIDFSTKDTRYSFVSHLSAALRRRNISIFLGEDCLQAATQSAIEGAKVFVVIFSDNYASSPLCLETLMKFLDLQRREKGPVMIPVFYGDVTPSIVEQQTGSFGDALSEHQRLFSEDDRVERWRNGLVEAAKLQGYESNEQPNDSELVEEIVADVRERLFPTGKIGSYLRLVGIENLICKQSQDFYRLGIWGMPGIGKTTIAQAVFNQMSQDFEALCFLQDFHLKFHEKGLHILREEHSIEKLRGKTVLLVLDDVRNPMEAESFLGGFDSFGLASLIIITSRDKQVLYQCQVEGVYEVPSFNKKESLQLLNGFAFPKESPSDSNLVGVLNKVVEYANGNPAALCFYGRELEKWTKPEEMEADFEKIKLRCPQREIIDMFKSSYDVLSDNERSIFLDIACFFNGEQLDRIMQIFEGCGFFPHVGIERLVERSLLRISKTKKVEMHNLIQDIAREIVNEENNQILRRRRLWNPSSIRLLLADTEPKGTEVIEGLFLDTTNLDVVINPKAFENMYNLRLLKIHSSSSEPAQELHLPNGLESLPYELKLLHWENYPLQSLPQDFDPNHLVEINMPYSQLQNLWGGTKSLPKLTIINLSHSQQLVEVDELSKACSLEKIILQGCTMLERIPRLDQLKNLQVLNLSCCTRIKREEIIEKIKVLDQEVGLRETESGSMVFSTIVKPEDNTESF